MDFLCKESELLSAITSGDVSSVKQLITSGVSVNAVLLSPSRHESATLLGIAAYEGQVNVMRALLAARALVNYQDPWLRRNALHWACIGGHRSAAELVISSHIDVNCTDRDKVTPLLFAAMFARTEVVPLLIASGADVARYDRLHATALHYASFHGEPEFVAMVIRAGCVANNAAIFGQGTPLANLAHHGDSSNCRLLLDAGYDYHEDAATWMREESRLPLPYSNSTDDLHKHLLSELSHPPSLMRICRFFIRKHLAMEQMVEQLSVESQNLNPPAEKHSESTAPHRSVPGSRDHENRLPDPASSCRGGSEDSPIGKDQNYNTGHDSFCQQDCLCHVIPSVHVQSASVTLDVEEIQQVLGRDILRSNLLENIGLYLECEDDSLQTIPVEPSPRVNLLGSSSIRSGQLTQPGFIHTSPSKAPTTSSSLPAEQLRITSEVTVSKPTSMLHGASSVDGRYPCPHCQRTFSRDNLARDHRAKVHGELGLFRCGLCTYEARTSRLLSKHTSRRHHSRVAEQKLNSRQVTENHVSVNDLTMSVHRADTTTVPCSSENASEHAVLVPEIREDSDQIVYITPRANVIQKIPIPGTNCYIVSEVIDNESKRLQQNKERKPGGSEVDAAGHTKDTKSSGQSTNDSPTSCGRSRARVKEATKVYRCQLCPFECGSASALKRHQESRHERPAARHCCDKCGCTFRQRRSLDTHMRVHAGQFDFVCEVCEKSFASSDHLRLHRQTHKLACPFPCQQPGCRRAFRTNGRLRQHVRMVHQERHLCCPQPGCGKAFAAAHQVAAHLRAHSGAFRCLHESCGRTFRDAHNLRSHQRTHGFIK